MPLPAGTASIRVHPSIGFARLSDNPDYFVFGEPTPNYKSNGRIRRQAVRFTLFAYRADGQGIEELTPQRLAQLNIGAVWKVRVVNRKIARKRDDSYTIVGTGSSDQNGGQLFGRCGDFVQGQRIPLGQISADGLFIPPIAGLFKAANTTPIPTGGMYSRDISDNTGDGPVSVELFDATTGTPIPIIALPAWVFITPPDFAPDWDDVGPDRNLLEWLRDNLHIVPSAPSTPVNAAARALDRASIECGTSDFAPGIEMDRPDPQKFYSPLTLGDMEEIRLMPAGAAGAQGAVPGELTAGLCSPWQFDFAVCTCHYWVNQRPDVAFQNATNGPEVNWLRKDRNDTNPQTAALLEGNVDFVNHVFELGIIRKDADQRVEQERDNNIP